MSLWRLVYYSQLKYWLWSGGVFLIASSLLNNKASLVQSPLFWSLFIFFLFPFNAFINWIKVLASDITNSHQIIKALPKDFQTWALIGFAMLMILLVTAQFYLKVLLICSIIILGIYGVSATYIKLHKALPYLFGICLSLPAILGFNLFSLRPMTITLSLAFLMWSLGMSLFLESEQNKFYAIFAGVLWTTVSLLLLKITVSPLVLGLSLTFPLMTALQLGELYEHKMLTHFMEYLIYFTGVGVYLYSSLL